MIATSWKALTFPIPFKRRKSFSCQVANPAMDPASYAAGLIQQAREALFKASDVLSGACVTGSDGAAIVAEHIGVHTALNALGRRA